MVGIVKEINGQKTIIPLTTDAGTGAPVGTLISQYKKVAISGYLYCDGSTFDQNAYPVLYMYLGTNVLPDYRECVMVGAEQNTTDTIAAHDVYGEGEFKDDQMQEHTHKDASPKLTTDAGNLVPGLRICSSTAEKETSTNSGRSGTTTHGKQKAVYVYIKATSGLAENQQDNVLNDVKDYVDNSNSYSTQEVKTGGTWIDGKPIYRRAFYSSTNWSSGATIGKIENIDVVIRIHSTSCTNNGNWFTDYNVPNLENTAFIQSDGSVVVARAGTFQNNLKSSVIIEYTKTTD